MTLSLLLALAAAAPLLLHAGFLNTRGGGDSPFLLFRLHQLCRALSDGHFPVRWMSDAAFGLGYPFFNYYAALPYYVAALFRALGASYVLSLKLTHLIGFLLAGGAAFAWVRCITGRQDAALLASAVYTFAPFHLVNVYVRGDSLSEFWAMAWFPLILLTLHRAAEQLTARRLVALAAVYAALITTHNVSALVFSPFMIIYGVVLAWRPDPFSFKGRFLISLLLAGMLGLALAAWFWLPAIAEQGVAQLGVQTTGYFFYGNHFRAGDLVQPTFLFDYDISRNPFSMGLIQAVLIVPGIVAFLLRLRMWRQDGVVLFCLALATAMITPLSRPLWDAIPMLPLTQFPWRFLGIQALFGAAIVGALAEALPHRWGAALAMTGSALMLIAGLGALPLNFVSITDDDVTAERLQWYEAFSGNIGTTIRHEYLPTWANPRPYTSDVLLGRAPTARFLEGEGALTQTYAITHRQTWEAAIDSESARLALPLLYWPGWSAWVDGEPVVLAPTTGLGYVQLDAPQGTHEITLRLEHTPLRMAAEATSVVAAIGIAVAWLLRVRAGLRPAPTEGIEKPSHHVWRWLMAPGALIALFVLFHILPNAAGPDEVDTLSADFDQETYFHPNLDGIAFADGSRLRGYEVVSTDPLGVRLMWDAPTDAVVDLTLAPPPPLARLGAPEDAAVAGLYAPRLALTDPTTGQNVPALTADGQTRGAIYLRPVVVEVAPTVDCNPDTAQFDAISLCVLGTEYGDGALNLTASWQTETQIPQNYALALRLRDAAGYEWAVADVQAGGAGMFPTALWPPGEVVSDGYRLEVMSGAPPLEDYTLTLTLYDPTTLNSLGSHDQRGVTIDATPAAPNLPTLHNWPNEGLLITDAAFPDTIAQGDPLITELRWVTSEPPEQSYRLLWTLGDAWTTETPLAPGSDPATWEADVLVNGVNVIHPPSAIAPGNHSLTVHILDEAGDIVGIPIMLGEVTITGRERLFEPPPLDVMQEVTFGEALQLWGYTFAQTGDTLTLTLAWGATGAPDRDYAYFVHVFDPATEAIVAQIDTMPGAYTYPTTRWVAGEVVVEDVTLDLSDAPPGTYTVALGWYDPATSDRLAAAEYGERLSGDRLVLAERVVR